MTVDNACPYCLIPDKTQHSLKQSGRCDGLRKGKLKLINGKYVEVQPTPKSIPTN